MCEALNFVIRMMKEELVPTAFWKLDTSPPECLPMKHDKNEK